MRTLLNKMKVKPFRICRGSALLLGFLVLVGCNESGGGDKPVFTDDAAESSESASASSGSVPNIKGTWTGQYVVYGGTDAYDGQAVTAKIKQDKDAVVITTNLPVTGRFLTGTIKSDGDMTLTDAYDGELWTTHFEPATTTSMRIADFLTAPSVENPDPPIGVIELSK